MVISDKNEEFAKRLNTILDLAEFAPYNRGRQVLLAKKYGVSQKGAGKWLTGEGMPRRERIVEIAEDFGCDRNWLHFGEGAMNPDDIVHIDKQVSALERMIVAASVASALHLKPESAELSDFCEQIQDSTDSFESIMRYQFTSRIPNEEDELKSHLYRLIRMIDGKNLQELNRIIVEDFYPIWEKNTSDNQEERAKLKAMQKAGTG